MYVCMCSFLYLYLYACMYSCKYDVSACVCLRAYICLLILPCMDIRFLTPSFFSKAKSTTIDVTQIIRMTERPLQRSACMFRAIFCIISKEKSCTCTYHLHLRCCCFYLALAKCIGFCLYKYSSYLIINICIYIFYQVHCSSSNIIHCREWRRRHLRV